MAKKLIEVALPLPEINDASAYDKMPGIGPHPKGIHHWWARLPLPTARAVLFASVVDDPSVHPEKFQTEEAQNAERERLFGILRRLMQKKMHERPEVYAEARTEMLKHCGEKLPPVLDPFAGGGSIPLEANRLGFEAHACDLNPVAVLLNKCNLEIVPRWLGKPAVNPEARKDMLIKPESKGATGLADDVRYYGGMIRSRAIDKIGHLYPKVRLSSEQGGGSANVIAWIWARTVASPNPAARGAHVPLISTFWLNSPRKGKNPPFHWLEPQIDKSHCTYTFVVRQGQPTNKEEISSGTKAGKGKSGFKCLLTDTPISFDYIKSESIAGRMGTVMVAIVAEGRRSRIYLNASDPQMKAATAATPDGFPDTDLPDEALGFRVQNYGVRKHWQLFTARQLTAMTTLMNLVKQIGPEIERDAKNAGLPLDDAREYARAVSTFLALALNRCADFNNALCGWKASGQQSMHLFGLQVIRLLWDFVEPNIMGEKAVCWITAVDICADAIEAISSQPHPMGRAHQSDAAAGVNGLRNLLVSTDPPYYDNISYGALSDFFYIWLRGALGESYPEDFRTVLVPKMPELIASPDRFGNDKQQAKEHFESGFRKAFTSLREQIDPRFPLTVYYAFKQEDQEAGESDGGDEDESATTVDLTTGWETLLEALLSSGFHITATWPVRASQAWRMRAMGSNALASYIVLACRPRPEDAPRCSRRDFLAELKKELPSALKHLRQGNIAPVDFQQAALGPGMGVFSRYAQVLEANGKPMTVRSALSLINQILDETISEQAGDFDPDTRWAISWFEEHGMDEGEFGKAEQLSKSKNTSVTRLAEEKIIVRRAGKVHLVRRSEFDKDWDPAEESRLPAWIVTQHFVRALEDGGENAAAALLRKAGAAGETARDLAYRLYSICEKNKWAQEGLAYNSLVVAWPEIVRLSSGQGPAGGQGKLL